MVVACDIPNVDAAFVERMLGEAGDVDAVVPTSAGLLEPLCAVYRRRLLPAVREALARGERGVRSMLENQRVRYLALGPRQHLANVNTPADYEACLLESPDHKGAGR
jgi:molybdopterin-guanine dinucleotide biosynthesis protein A